MNTVRYKHRNQLSETENHNGIRTAVYTVECSESVISVSCVFSESK